MRATFAAHASSRYGASDWASYVAALPIVTLRWHLEALTPLCLGPVPAATVRSALGPHLKPHAEAFAHLFGSGDGARPSALQWDGPVADTLLPGTPATVSLSLVGPDEALVAAVSQALDVTLAGTLGSHRDAGLGCVRVLGTDALAPMHAPGVHETLARPVRLAYVYVTSPALVTDVKTRRLEPLSTVRLVEAAAWRVNAVARAVGLPPPPPSDAVLAAAEALHADCDFNVVKAHRHSARQGQDVSLDGLVGRMVLRGEVRPIVPLLVAATRLGIGKGTARGRGAVRLFLSP